MNRATAKALRLLCKPKKMLNFKFKVEIFKRSNKKLNEESPEKFIGKNSARIKNENSRKSIDEKIAINGINIQ